MHYHNNKYGDSKRILVKNPYNYVFEAETPVPPPGDSNIVAEDGTTFIVAEDGSTFMITE